MLDETTYISLEEQNYCKRNNHIKYLIKESQNKLKHHNFSDENKFNTQN